MLLIGLKNFAAQSVAVGGLVNFNPAYREVSQGCSDCSTFDNDSTSVSLNKSGIYHVTATAIVSAPAAGNVTLSLYENGVAIPGALATETITTADTEFRTLTIDYYVIVDSGCVLGKRTTFTKALTLVNTGVAATISNVVLNVELVAY